MSLKNKRIIVTGGCTGIGAVFTRYLISQGAFVIPTSRKDYGITSFLKTLTDQEKKKCRPEILLFDNENNIDQFIDKLKGNYESIYALINNAVGRCTQKYPEQITIEDLRKEYEVNVFATTYLTIQAIERLIEENGSVVNISSFYSEVVPDNRVYNKDMQPTGVGYASSKASINYITKYLAAYYAYKNIRVNAILPGGVVNPERQTDYFVKEYVKRTPMNRMANKNEFNEALYFLLSDKNLYCTGQFITIDGGWSIW
ncbi:TPA: SDR family oxidoreductase [Clostridium botulinum]|uniref:SDR family oxidoreductase n=1 Tax=Clostridium botulinum TaxID=1491 RepID=UPI0033117CB8|nr:SDR family oxidoreductase [Clostridium botulinum]